MFQQYQISMMKSIKSKSISKLFLQNPKSRLLKISTRPKSPKTSLNEKNRYCIICRVKPWFGLILWSTPRRELLKLWLNRHFRDFGPFDILGRFVPSSSSPLLLLSALPHFSCYFIISSKLNSNEMSTLNFIK